MKKYVVIGCLLTGLFAFKKGIDYTSREAAVKEAISRSLPVLESSSHTFLINAAAMINCHSCHNQGIGVVAFSLAKEKGFDVSNEVLHEALDSTHSFWNQSSNNQMLAENSDPVAIIMTGNYDLWALSSSNYKTTKTIDLVARNIMRKQMYDGGWVSPGQRPPMEYYSFTATALTVKNIQSYMPAVLHDEVKQRIAKARTWLINTKPEANEEKVFRLLGLMWSGADKEFITQQAKNLLADQHADGGWPQLETLPTDAYASGQALYALQQSGQLSVTDSAYQKGIDFLLKTQEADGTWHVKTRSYPFVPYVNSGFPHEADQFISAAGSNWATIALLLSIDDYKRSK